MIMALYVLDGHVPRPVDNTLRWAQWMCAHNRVVQQTQVDESVRVSTVFLGLNHQWGDGPPLVFETMIFGGPYDSYMDRYSTWAEAELGHEAAVRKCLDG